MLFEPKEVAMSDKNKSHDKSEMKHKLEKAIDAFLNEGGEVTRLRYADQKTINKASRNFYHKDKEDSNERSKEIAEKERQKEESLIFSKVERYSI